MPKVNIPEPFNLQLTDPHSRAWLFKLNGSPRIDFLTQDQFNIVINAEGRKIGDFDEQRDWSGGRGGERFQKMAQNIKTHARHALGYPVMPSRPCNGISQRDIGTESWSYRDLFHGADYLAQHNLFLDP